jgi:hypothetical protein
MLHAACLSRDLRSRPALDRPAMPYFDLARVVVDAAWGISTIADLDLPHVDGRYPRGYRLMKWFSGELFRASLTDTVINDRLALVTSMTAHPAVLASPRILFRALWVNLKARLR